MPVKIMFAGCPKDEREPAETSVKAALGQAAGSWTVSLVKIGRQWSMTVDGPELKHKTLMVPEGGIKQAIQELLPRAASTPVPSAPPPSPATPAPRAPAPPTVAAPGKTAPRAPAPIPAFSPVPAAPAPKPVTKPVTTPAPAAPVSRAPLPPTRSDRAPAPRAAPRPTAQRAPSPPTRTPQASPRPAPFSAKSGERQDRYECQFCGGVFLVIYEASGGSSQETVAVACPHCWKNSHVMVSEEAALSRDYRAEKA